MNERGKQQGLSASQAAERLLEYGLNMYCQSASRQACCVFLSASSTVRLSISCLWRPWCPGCPGKPSTVFFIFVVLLINAVIGTVQEFSAERAASALRKMVLYRTTVVRDGRVVVVNTADIVPGDFVLLVSGDRVPVDRQ